MMLQNMPLSPPRSIKDVSENEARTQYWEYWNEDNKEAIAAYNARIAEEGLPLAKYCTFASSLNDGGKS